MYVSWSLFYPAIITLYCSFREDEFMVLACDGIWWVTSLQWCWCADFNQFQIHLGKRIRIKKCLPVRNKSGINFFCEKGALKPLVTTIKKASVQWNWLISSLDRPIELKLCSQLEEYKGSLKCILHVDCISGSWLMVLGPNIWVPKLFLNFIELGCQTFYSSIQSCIQSFNH